MTNPANEPAKPSWMLRPGKSMVDLLMLSVVAVWGLNFAVMKGMFSYFEPFAFTCLRFMAATLVLFFILKSRRIPMRVRLRDLPGITGLGVLANTLYQSLFVTGLSQTKAGNAALLTSLAPIFAYLTGIVLKREGYSHRVLGGILLSISGAGMIVLFGSKEVSLGANLRGDLMILAAAMCWGGYTGAAAGLIIKYGPLRLTLWGLLTGTLLMIPPMFPAMMRQDWASIPLLGWVGFCYSTFLSIVYCYLIWSYALQQVGVARTAIFSNLTPLVALLGGWLLLGEQPVLSQFAGTLLILTGVFLVRSGRPVYILAKAGLRVTGFMRHWSR